MLLPALLLLAATQSPAAKPKPTCAEVRLVNSDYLAVESEAALTILYNKPGQYGLPRQLRGQTIAGMIVTNFSDGIAVYSVTSEDGRKLEDSLSTGEEGKYGGQTKLADGEFLIASPGVVVVYLLKGELSK